jgi:plastocyanin
MKVRLLSLLMFLFGTPGFCTTWIITNTGFTFTPATITITLGDDVNFTLDAIHNAVEVSLSTWNINGNTPLAGGFQTPTGGGLVQTSQLGVGTHYYVCSPHASLGMKGTIIVQSTTGITDTQLQQDFSVYPNPSLDLITIKAGENLIGSQYYITDLAGRQIFNGKFIEETTPLDVSQLKNGIYLIQVAGQRRQNIKFIKN